MSTHRDSPEISPGLSVGKCLLSKINLTTFIPWSYQWGCGLILLDVLTEKVKIRNRVKHHGLIRGLVSPLIRP